MVVLQACWSPCWCYNNIKHGTVAVAIYTIVACVVGILYCSWVMKDGVSNELYSPFFESDLETTTPIVAGILITFSLLFIIFSILLIVGTRHDIRGLFIPYLVWMTILILYTTSLGIWFIARYYTYPISVLSAMLTWLFTGINIYCLLCVISQYQVLRDYQSANIVFLYP